MEQKAGSVLSSVAILYHELGDDLDAAVRASLSHLRELVASFDKAAAVVLAAVPDDRPQDLEAASAVIALMRMINTGNLEWRYVVYDFAKPPLLSWIPNWGLVFSFTD